ncbi:hypothetical protein ILYODFUR_034878 [Ilyodon furcidens]|uniref:Uncharacterized protein n=1 Tax=Ilyodon furcidens TaxID=33524 RepID=A0ABV0TPE4_9TELE
MALLHGPLLHPALHHTARHEGKGPYKSTPASAHKHNRADITEYRTHNRPPNPTPRPDKLTQQEVSGQWHTPGASGPHHAHATTQTHHITATATTAQGDTPTRSSTSHWRRVRFPPASNDPPSSQFPRHPPS